jgi:hypothetical protein
MSDAEARGGLPHRRAWTTRPFWLAPDYDLDQLHMINVHVAHRWQVPSDSHVSFETITNVGYKLGTPLIELSHRRHLRQMSHRLVHLLHRVVLATCLIGVGLGRKLVKFPSLVLLIMSYCAGVPPPHVAKDGADVTCSQHSGSIPRAARLPVAPAGTAQTARYANTGQT